MCGICGIYDPHGGIDEGHVRRMNETLRHRGPDAEAVKPFGKCTLAYTRLSIIDLCGGQQPMPNEDRSLWITFNGEIFNYIELRDELQKAG